MDSDKFPDFLRGSYEGSYARRTISERLPVIITKIIDTLCRDKANIIEANDADDADELKRVCSRLSELKSSMQRNRALAPLQGPASDIAAWNRALTDAAAAAAGAEAGAGEVEAPLLWYSAPWLLIECYMYRRVKQIMECTSVLATYDYFREQKLEALASSLHAARHLAERLQTLVAADACEPLTSDQFTEFLEASLWANRNDLSHRANCDDADRDSDCGATSGATAAPSWSPQLWRHHVLANDTEPTFQLLTYVRQKSGDTRRLDVILDNFGLELFCDLALVELLTARGYFDSVVLHVKSMPWYVSDCTAQDIDLLLQRLTSTDLAATGATATVDTPAPAAATAGHSVTVTVAAAAAGAGAGGDCTSSTISGSSDVLARAACRWRALLADGTAGARWRVQSHWFWTSAHAYEHMARLAPDLYRQLTASSLLLFKGDLNYRKLVADRAWPPATPLATAVGDFKPAPLLALRTLKADVVCGVESGEAERAATADADWLVSGQWAVVQLLLR